MDDNILKGIGLWLLAIGEAGFAFLLYWAITCCPELFINEFCIFIGSVIAASQILVVFFIKYFFGITDAEYHARNGTKPPE